MFNRKVRLLIVSILLVITVSVYSQDWPSPDLSEDGIVNFTDYAILAENWLKTGAGLKGDFDESGVVDLDDLEYLGYYWLAEQWDCEGKDLYSSGMIDFADLAFFADAWLSDINDISWDGRCDFDDNGLIDFYDLKVFCDCWQQGTRPEEVFGSFKAALAAGNIDEAVSYFIDFVAEDYRVIFNENIDKLQNMADDMGDMSLESIDGGLAVYEISNIAGTNFYPVVFTLDDDGSWKIVVF